MENNLLLAKLRMPFLQRSFVKRPRLLAHLDEVSLQESIWQHKLTLVTAPAGYGKTTLLSQWLSGTACAVAWLSLDENDNDPTRFLTYLVAALQQAIPDLDAGIVDSLHSPSLTQPGGSAPLELALTNLLNELELLRDPTLLVLDDYHLIENTHIHDAVSFLLDNQPPQLHLVIAGRADPPLPTARLRAQGKLRELHAADLSFAPDEAAAFLNDAMELDLTAEEVQGLARRTEGWIVGLQLAALALQGTRVLREQARETAQEDEGASAYIEAFIETFSGSHRFILDYLTEEVLNQQNAETRSFLLQTAVLDRLSAPLCNALIGGSDSQRLLEMLSAAHLFIIPLDDERRWYRYHHLFADLLRQRLGREQPDLVPQLHRRASTWYEAQGWLEEAVQHALYAEDFVRGAALLEQNGWTMLMRGEMNILMRWLDALPEELLDRHLSLGLLRAWSLAFSGQWEEMERTLRGFGTEALAGETAAVRAYATAVQGAVTRTKDLAEQALAQLPEDAALLRALVAFCLAITHFSSGQPEPAATALTDVIRLGTEAGQNYLVMTATAQLGHVHEMQGALRQALETYRQALRLGSTAKSQPVPFHGIAFVGIAELLYEWNDLEGALSHAHEGIRLTQRGGFVSYMLAGYATLVQAYQAQGDLKNAETILQKGEQLARQHKYRYMEGVFADLRARQWLAQGELAAAARWAQRCHDQGNGTTALAQEIQRMTVARVLAAQGTSAAGSVMEGAGRALVVLDQALAEAEAAGRRRNLIRILALQAVACHKQGQTEQALAVLGRALAMAGPEGYMRTFLDEGPPMAHLLRNSVTGDGTTGYAATLLAAFEEETAPATTAATTLVEPLSEREVEVLRLIVAGLSNRQIAQEMVIAHSTVKTHINNIYGKLDVNRRTQAVIKAQELGLL